VRRISERADLGKVHPHMLRHACGCKLANDSQDTRAIQHYLGQKNIQHTVRYPERSSERSVQGILERLRRPNIRETAYGGS
jgi:integrase